MLLTYKNFIVSIFILVSGCLFLSCNTVQQKTTVSSSDYEPYYTEPETQAKKKDVYSRVCKIAEKENL